MSGDRAPEWDERLRDGRQIVVRPIRPDDRDALAAGMRELSPESRYRRFLSPADRLSEAELSYLTEVDHHDHEALVAEEPASGAGIGVARFVRLDDPQVAEVAMAVADDWHNRGVGTILLQRLTERARAEGIRSFSAEILAENRPMLHMIRELGEVSEQTIDHGSVEVEVELPDDGIGSALSSTLKAAASGLISVRNLKRR